MRDRLRMWWFINREWVIRCLKIVAAVALVVLLLYLVWLCLPCGRWGRPKCLVCEGVDAAIQKRNVGEYGDFKDLVASGLKSPVAATCWKPLQDELDAKVTVGFKLEFLRGPKGAAQSIPGHVQLSTDDSFWLTIHPAVRSYLYIFKIDAARRLSVVFPYGGLTGVNPVSAAEQRIPGNGKSLAVSEQAGAEHLYLVAAAWEISDLDRIGSLATTADESTRKDLAKRFQSRVEKEKRWAEPLPGLAYGEWVVESLGVAKAAGDARTPNVFPSN